MLGRNRVDVNDAVGARCGEVVARWVVGQVFDRFRVLAQNKYLLDFVPVDDLDFEFAETIRNDSRPSGW